jgi:regulator of protease activity HflC (stomatin/prohibitin superfamily)
MSVPSVLADRGKKMFWKVGLAAVCAAGVAPWLMTRVIVTEPGYNTVVVNAPWIGEYSYEKEALPPGRTMVWVYSFGIPVKTGTDTIFVQGEEVATKDGKSVILYAQVKLRVTDPQLLISSFGENWYKDWAKPLMQKSLEIYAGKHDRDFFQAMNGPQASSFELLERMQDDFEDFSMPLEVQYAAPDYVQNLKEPRYVLSADAKKWTMNPDYRN